MKKGVREASVIRFLKLVGCSNDQIGDFSKSLRLRNRLAHPSGTVLFNDQREIDDHITEVLVEIENIQNQMHSIILDIYYSFLQDNCVQEEREYIEDSDQIREILINKNYLSRKDIEICLGFDITNLTSEKYYDNIKELHETFTAEYKEFDE